VGDFWSIPAKWRYKIKNIVMDKKTKKSGTAGSEDEKFPLPVYPAKEDIYSKDKEESFDELGVKKQRLKGEMDEGLDVPGAELDDEDESVGAEDEENNYYSLGGEDHHDLTEDQGD
jgi:hypothetical protein